MARSSFASSATASGLLLLVLLIVQSAGPASATARLGQTMTATSSMQSPYKTSSAVSNDDTQFSPAAVQQSILNAAAASLSTTLQSVADLASATPDVVDARTGEWHTDDINANGAAGPFASALWSMHKLTGDDCWKVRALAASASIRPHVKDISMGQAIGTLAFPALKLAYEAEQDPSEKQAFLDAALLAATTLSSLYARIPGVIKARSTADIAAEAKLAGVAAKVSPMAVFSSPEGSAAATGLLAWAATLPGGRAAWAEMAVTNAKRIAADHVDADGSVRGTLIYKSTSATFQARPIDTLDGQDATPATQALESWMSSVAGQASSTELRQALTILTLAQAARSSSASCITTAQQLVHAAKAAATNLASGSLSSDPLSTEPAGAATAALAFAELSSLPEEISLLTQSQADTFAQLSRNIVLALASDRLRQHTPSSSASSTLTAAAQKWVLSLFRGSSSSETTEEAQEPSTSTTLVPVSILVRSGSRSSSCQESPSSDAPSADCQAGSMLADQMLLQAMERLSEASQEGFSTRRSS